MSYVKNEWRRGDIVTAEKLNHMEDGIVGGWPADLPKPSAGGYGYTDENDTAHKIDEKYLPEAGGAMVVNAFYNENTDSYVVDKTLEEIYRSSPNVKLVIRDPEDGLHTVLNLISASMDGVSFETVLHSFGMDGTITGINCTAINISPDGYVEYNEGSIAF